MNSLMCNVGLRREKVRQARHVKRIGHDDAFEAKLLLEQISNDGRGNGGDVIRIRIEPNCRTPRNLRCHPFHCAPPGGFRPRCRNQLPLARHLSGH